MNKQPLIVITGPTSVGKTENSIKIAKAFDGEIISADSMQVYRGMDIGTAKVKADEMDGVRHHLIDILSPFDEFNIYQFKALAKKAIDDISSRGKIPVIAGGTGFYIQAVLKDIDFEEEDESGESEIRFKLNQIAGEKGASYLHSMLREIDPKAAESIHENNIKRVIRAIEFNMQTGNKISEHNARQTDKESPYDYMYFVINNDRDILYKRIEQRIDEMLADGLVDEVKRLKDAGANKDMVSMKGIGYKEILAYLDGETTLEEAVYILKRDTRHFAKRQLTWFRREKDVIWMDYSDYNQDKSLLLADMKKMIGEHYGITEKIQ